MSAKRLNIRLFIEGIEVPVTGATVTAQVMSPAQASIVIPATDAVHGILPRSVVHLFYYDANKPVGTLTSSKDSDPDSADKRTSDLKDLRNPHNWNLVFAGEVMAYRYVKDEAKRQVVLQCTDFMNYMQSAKIYYRSRSTSNRHFQQAIFAGGVRIRRGKKTVNRANDLISILHTKPSTVPTLQGLLGGVVHMMESISGVYDKKSVRKFRGVSDFYAQAELRLRLSKMIGVSPRDTSSSLFTGSYEFRRYIRMLSMQLRHSASFGQLLGVLLSVIQHQYSPVLCPPYIARGAKAKYLKLVPRGPSRSDLVKGADKELDAILDNMSAALEDRFRETAKKKNVEDQFQSIAEHDGSKPQIKPDTENQAAWKDTWDAKIPTSEQAEDRKRRLEALEVDGKITALDRRIINQKAKHTADAVAIVKDRLMAETQGASGEPRFGLHDKHGFAEAADAIKKARGTRLPGRKFKQVSRELEMSDRLVATLFSPNIWMCPPPRCNVIFPDQYTQVQFSRNWMSEISRLWLHGLWRSGRANFSQSYFAPNIDVVNGQVKKKDVARAATNAISFLLPHEKFTGIVPAIQGVGYAEALKRANKALEEAQDDQTGIAKTSLLSAANVKNRGLARAANSKFLDARFAPRSMSVTGPFNPNLVCGLPAAVLDPQLVSDEVSLRATARVAGKHYLGRILSVTHSFSQSGAGTSVNMSHCRTHDEGLDIFGEKDEDTATVSLKKKVSKGGTKLPTTKKLYAEVYRWRFSYETIKLRGIRERRLVATPVIGMLGVSGKTGVHITRGLYIQDAPIGSHVPPEFRRSDRDKDGKLIEKVKVDPYTVRPVRNKNLINPMSDAVSTTRTDGLVPGAAPTRITKDRELIDGYEYTKPLPWMSERAVGAVVVDAYRADSEPGTFYRKFKFTFEQIARYPWLAPIYLNQNIGPEFYEELLGCGSVVDPQQIAQLDQAVAAEYGVRGKDLLSELGDDIAIRPSTIGTVGRTIEYPGNVEKVTVTRRDGSQFEVPVDVLGGVPIEVALEALASAYQRYVTNDIDVRSFITQYNSRKFASMVDIFGLGYKEDNVVGTRYVRPLEEYTSEVGDFSAGPREDAKDGFHSYAFGDVENLSNIKYVPTGPIPDTLGQDRRPINPRVDPRKERYEAVLDYRDSLGVRGTRG